MNRPPLTKPTAFAPTALFFITLGALITVWSGVWYYYLLNHSSAGSNLSYVCLGCLLTGVILLAIGFSVGPMARWSRQAELPPTDPSTTPSAASTRNVTSGRV